MPLPANARPQMNYDPDELPTHYTPDQAVAMIQGANRNQKLPPAQKTGLKTAPPPDFPQQRKQSPRLHHPYQPQPQLQSPPPPQPQFQPQFQSPHQNPPSHSYPQHTRPPPPTTMNQMQRISQGMLNPNNNHARPAPAPMRGPPHTSAPYNPASYQAHASPQHSQPLHQQHVSPNPHQHHQHTSGGSLPGMTSAAGPPGTASLTQIFHEVNISGGRTLTETELVAALVRLNRSFDPATVRMLIGDFANPNKPADGVDLEGFYSLWDYLRRWKDLYHRFDYDGNGRIGLVEFENALFDFGYRLRPQFVSTMFELFETRGRRRVGPHYGDGISFDLFVQAGLFLSKVTNCFLEYDKDRDGYVTLGFEEFLHELLIIVG